MKNIGLQLLMVLFTAVIASVITIWFLGHRGSLPSFLNNKIPSAWAASTMSSKRVTGSSNIAVESFKLQGLLYILWSNGCVSEKKSISTTSPFCVNQADLDAYITSMSTSTSVATLYSAAPIAADDPLSQDDNVSDSNPKMSGRPIGSPFVAVGIVRDTKKTGILFADGSILWPTTPDPLAGSLVNTFTPRGLFGYCNNGNYSLTQSPASDNSNSGPCACPLTGWVRVQIGTIGAAQIYSCYKTF